MLNFDRLHFKAWRQAPIANAVAWLVFMTCFFEWRAGLLRGLTHREFRAFWTQLPVHQQQVVIWVHGFRTCHWTLSYLLFAIRDRKRQILDLWRALFLLLSFILSFIFLVWLIFRLWKLDRGRLTLVLPILLSFPWTLLRKAFDNRTIVALNVELACKLLFQ